MKIWIGITDRNWFEEFQNGRDYYALDGKPVKVLPDLERNRPAPEFLRWHNEQMYLG
jgi:putative restriction endonuclease